MLVELLVLANSAKNGGRCLAGIDTHTGRWIRPVANAAGSELPNGLTVIAGRRIRPGDLIHLELGDSVPRPHHPENRILNSAIREVREQAYLQHLELIEGELRRPNPIVAGHTKALEAAEIPRAGVSDSLGVLIADAANFFTNFGKHKVSLQIDGATWTLPNTDDWGKWSGTLRETLVCVSLAELFPEQQAHYKLASGFIPLDPGTVTSGRNEALQVALGKTEQATNLLELIAKRSNMQPLIDKDDRFLAPRWFWQAKVRHPCIRCGAATLDVFRAHVDVPKNGNFKVLHRYALLCHDCNTVFTTPLTDEKYRKALSQACDAVRPVATMCPDCLPQ